MIKLRPKRKGKRIVDPDYLDAVANLGCCLCGSEATIHHDHKGEGMGQRASDYRSIPLCPTHHQHGKYGEAIEKGGKVWAFNYGSVEGWLEWVWEQLEIPEEQREKWRRRDYELAEVDDV